MEHFTRPFSDEASRKNFEHVVQTLLNRIHDGRTPLVADCRD